MHLCTVIFMIYGQYHCPFWQVHRAWMRGDMVPDESIVEEVLADMDDHDSDDPSEEIDYAEGNFLRFLGCSRHNLHW